MEFIYVASQLLLSFGVSLGVGSSTLTVLGFLTAVRDGVVDQSERRIMHIMYLVLRVAMVVILLALFTQGITLISAYGMDYLQPLTVVVWSAVFVLYLNAVLMTLHYMPKSIGPAIQAGTWYTLGVLSFMIAYGFTEFSYAKLFGGYLVLVVVMALLINGTFAHFKRKLVAVNAGSSTPSTVENRKKAA